MTVKSRKTGAKIILLLCGCSCPIACSKQDWRAQAITNAEKKVRIEINYPAAEFSGVQVTGNSTTGQTCGYITVKTGYAQLKKTVRFIVYIDGTAGPFIEAGLGAYPVLQQRFDFAWQYDCLKEGYKP